MLDFIIANIFLIYQHIKHVKQIQEYKYMFDKSTLLHSHSQNYHIIGLKMTFIKHQCMGNKCFVVYNLNVQIYIKYANYLSILNIYVYERVSIFKNLTKTAYNIAYI